MITLLLLTMSNVIAGSEDMNKTLAEANKLYKSGHFPQAQIIYEALLTKDENNNQILFQLGQISLLNNNTDNALHYFQRAYDNSGWFGKRWPIRTQTAARIAIAYYRQDDFANAAKWYRLAAGPIAFGPFKELRAFQKQTEDFGDSQPYIISGPSSTEIAFIQLDPLPIIEVSLNGKGPYYFFIDTGGADIILTEDVADELNIQRLGKIKGSFAAGQPSYITLAKLENIQLGEIQINNIPINIHKLDGVDEILQHKIHGVVSTSLLRHFYSSIDYKDKKLILRQLNDQNTSAMDKLASKGTAIPFWLAELHVILAQGHFNDQADTLFFVDTGLAGSGFSISEWALDAAGIKLDWGQAETATGAGGSFKSVCFTLERLTLGVGNNSISKENVPAERHENDLNIYQGVLGFEIGGTISHSFFKESSLTFDFVKMRLIINQ